MSSRRLLFGPGNKGDHLAPAVGALNGHCLGPSQPTRRRRQGRWREEALGLRTRLLTVSVRVLLILLAGLLLFLVLLLRPSNSRRGIRVIVNAGEIIEVLIDRMQIIEDSELTVVHA